MRLNFETLKYKNFLGSGNVWTTVVLNDSPSTLVIGKNGAGKSTILDALSFVLFGKPYRDINKPTLVNSINNGGMLVEVVFSIGSKNYKVIRGMKPNIFEIFSDGKLVNIDAKGKDYQEHLEKNIMHWNHKVFCQVVVLGSASYIPFMKLVAAHRRAVIEDLLDIQVFSSMMRIVKQKIVDNKDAIQNMRYNIDLTKEKIEVQNDNINDAKKDNEEAVRQALNDIAFEEEQIDLIKLKRKEIEEENEIQSVSLENKKTLELKLKKLNKFQSNFADIIEKVNKEIGFYETNDICPTCHQHIDAETKQSHISKNDLRKCEIIEASGKLSVELDATYRLLAVIVQIESKIADNMTSIARLKMSINNRQDKIETLKIYIDKLTKKKHNIQNNNTRLLELNEELKEYQVLYEAELVKKEYLEISVSMLKDSGIKSGIIRQYLPIMNKLVNKYLDSMNFFCNFTLNENFEEVIKSRHRDEFSYGNFSEGEKLRIDLSLLLTWRAVAKLKSSMDTNLLFLDEILDRSLDDNGTEEFISLMRTFSSDLNIFVFSPKAENLKDKFDTVIRFEKRNNFSELVKIVRNT